MQFRKRCRLVVRSINYNQSPMNDMKCGLGVSVGSMEQAINIGMFCAPEAHVPIVN